MKVNNGFYMPDLRKKLVVSREWLEQKYIQENLSCYHIAILLENVVTERSIHRRIKKLGIKIRSKKDAIFYIDGQRCKISQGYFWIWNPNHPRANGDYVKRATLVMEEQLGRSLADGEMVHHIDENRMNDESSNLQITNKYDHPFRIHKRGFSAEKGRNV